jgi:hypothetical protein
VYRVLLDVTVAAEALDLHAGDTEAVFIHEPVNTSKSETAEFLSTNSQELQKWWETLDRRRKDFLNEAILKIYNRGFADWFRMTGDQLLAAEVQFDNLMYKRFTGDSRTLFWSHARRGWSTLTEFLELYKLISLPLTDVHSEYVRDTIVAKARFYRQIHPTDELPLKVAETTSRQLYRDMVNTFKTNFAGQPTDPEVMPSVAEERLEVCKSCTEKVRERAGRGGREVVETKDPLPRTIDGVLYCGPIEEDKFRTQFLTGTGLACVKLCARAGAKCPRNKWVE